MILMVRQTEVGRSGDEDELVALESRALFSFQLILF
jgi:hypothetical protein